MTAVSRILNGIGRVGVITIGFLVTPVPGTVTTTILDCLHLTRSLWLTLGGSLIWGLLTFGALTAIDRLISS